MPLTQVGRGGLSADAIDASKVADDSIDSEHIATGSVDHAHLSADCVDGDNIVDNSINSEHYADGSIDHVHLAGDCVDGDNIADDSINSEHYVDASIDHAHLANDCVDGDNIADDSIDSEHYVDGSIDQAHIANEAINEARLQVSNAPTNGFFLSAQSGDTGGLTWAEPSGGTILQMQVSPMNIGTIQSGSKSSFTDSNVTASFTPTAADSTVFVHLSASIHAHSNHETHIDFDFDIQRQIGSGAFTTVEEYDGNFAIRQATTSGSTTGQWQSNCSFVLEDSPETTSQCTYMLRYRNTANGFLQWQTASTHVWTFMEIAA